MKRFLTAMVLALVMLAPAARADGPDDDYVNIYGLIQQGDTLNDKNQIAPAIAKYAEAQNALKRFQNNYHDWHEKIVSYRLKYLADKISELTARAQSAATATNTPVAVAVPAPAPVTTPEPVVTPEPVPEKVTPPPATTEADDQIKNLQGQIQQLQANNAVLEAKLKEALAAQPATMDPQEFAKAQDRIKSLQKENDLLKANLAQINTNVAPAILQNSARLQQDLAEANRKVAQLTQSNAALASQKDALLSQVKTSTVNDAATVALQNENELLKRKVADLQNRPAATTPDADLTLKLQQAQAQIAALQSDKDLLQSQKASLESNAKQALAAAATAPQALDSVTANRIAQLESQRDEMQKNLAVAVKDAAGHRKGKLLAARLDDLTREVSSLRPRIDVLEAKPVPYGADELALMSQPSASLVAAVRSPGHKPVKELPGGAMALMSEANEYFHAHDYDQAEQKYREALKLAPKNPSLLADMASIELEAGRNDEAEKNIQAALAIEPENDYSLFILGQIKFREKKYDEAMNALSHAAQLNPQNARVQNILGLTLSEKGLRGPAETAFRKAIQLDPGFADAHMNLAVVYLTQQPPLTELARWHYQKALATGHPANPSIEAMLNGEKPAAAP
jgi:cytochrome c-type biogenesis protein CcmH/NrfG